METLERIVAEHPFFTGLNGDFTKLLVGCAANVRFEPGSYIFREGGEANHFYLIRSGKVALEMVTPHNHPMRVYTVAEGDILGWSWLLPPYHWRFHAHAMEDTRAIALDGRCIRNKCELNHELGYQLFQRVAQVISKRLEATCFQLLDVYAVR
jgi:CRP-like cAMP-binding protein